MYLHSVPVEVDSWYRTDSASGSSTPVSVFAPDGVTTVANAFGLSGSTVRNRTVDGRAVFQSATAVLYLKRLTYQGALSGDAAITSTGRDLTPTPEATPGGDVAKVLAGLPGTYASKKNLRQAAPVQYAPRADVTKLRAANSDSPLAIPTYDGGNQLTHAAIAYDPEGWNGWKYWMVATPYAAANTQVENPSIYVANDPATVGGTNGWQVPAGLTNPIDPFPGGSDFNSDPDIEFGSDGKLYCFWRLFAASQVGAEERICVRSSSDGITWSAKTTVITNNALTRRPVAPSVVWTGTQWVMYAVDITPSPNTLLRYTNSSQDPTSGSWSGPTAVTIAGLSGTEAWHIDVNKWGDEWHMLINTTTIDASGAAGDLYVASSDDGLAFTCGSTPVLGRRRFAWDSSLYRSSMVPAFLGDEWGYEIMYAGYLGTAYYLGHTFAGFGLHRRQVNNSLGPIHGIAAPNLVNILASRVPLAPFTFGDAFQRADGASLGNADSGQTWTVQAGTPGISTKQAYATTAANTKAVLTGTADGYHEIALNALGTQAWLMFRGTDASNYWRLGYLSGNLTLQKIVAGAGTTVNANGALLTTFTAGARLGVLCSGNAITVCVDGAALGSFTDSFNASGTLIGFQTADSTTRFGPIYSRTLVAGS